jgi:hypothetical protein
MNFYPVVPGETFSNNFFASCLNMNMWMFALTQFNVQLFRGFMQGTDIAKIYEVQVRHMLGLSYLWTENFFIIWLVVWWFIALVYLLLKP